MTNFYAYIYRDPSRNNEPIYVGKGKNDRAYSHHKRADRHPFTQRLQFMAKNGVEPNIEVVPAIDEEHALFLEECLISILGRRDKKKGPLLNLTDGGEGSSGRILTNESRAKMRASHLGKTQSLETRARRIATQRGVCTKTPEAIAKTNAANRGKKRSPEICAKFALRQLGKTASPETKARMAASQKARWQRIRETRGEVPRD